MKNNAYEIMKEMWSIDEEIQKLTSELRKVAQISEEKLLKDVLIIYMQNF